MAKTTTVYFEKICDDDKNSIIFRTVSPKETTILVKSVEDGIVTVEPMDYCTIIDIAEIVAGCFVDDSNFWHEIIEHLNLDKNSGINGININFYGLTIEVTRENADVEKILKKWKDAEQKDFENQQNEITKLMYKSYRLSPEYRAVRAQRKLLIRLQKRFCGQ